MPKSSNLRTFPSHANITVHCIDMCACDTVSFEAYLAILLTNSHRCSDENTELI